MWGNVGAGVPARISGTAGAVTRDAMGAGWAQQLAEASAWPIWLRQLAASRVTASGLVKAIQLPWPSFRESGALEVAAFVG